MSERASLQTMIQLARGPSSSSWSSGLPPDLERQGARRVGAIGIALAIVFALGAALRQVAVSFGYPAPGEVMTWPMLAWVVLSLALAAWAFRSQNPGKVLKVALIYEVLLCLDTAVLENYAFDLFQPPPRLSIATLFILSFPLVVPTTLRKRVLTTIVSFAMVPLGAISMQIHLGRPLESWAFMAFGPTFIAMVLAILLSRIVHKLNVQVTKARQMGSYELVEKIGGGGMGEVWRARHRMLVRPAAIKLIRPDTMGGDGQRALSRFEREAQATSALRSPHTVELYDFGTTDEGSFYYAMELLRGLDLETLVNRFGPIPAERAIFLLRQVCHSLADAHAHGLVHRDVKPANVFVGKLGIEHDFIKVLDFGLVKKEQVRKSQDLNLSRENVAAGTPAFMAPELALGKDVDGRTDLYAVGCLGYWLLTGQLVFEAETPLEVAMMHVRDEPTPASEVSELPIPEALDGLLLECLAKEPEQRPIGARELERRLGEIELEAPWTLQRAESWWTTHAPEALVEDDVFEDERRPDDGE